MKNKSKTFCCETMREQLEGECPSHPNKLDCPDFVIIKTKSFFGIPIKDGSGSFMLINFCPWCGSKIT